MNWFIQILVKLDKISEIIFLTLLLNQSESKSNFYTGDIDKKREIFIGKIWLTLNIIIDLYDFLIIPYLSMIN